MLQSKLDELSKAKDYNCTDKMISILIAFNRSKSELLYDMRD